jgi:hypothetical protein
MFYSLSSRLFTAKLTIGFLMVAQMLGWITYARADEPAGSVTTTPQQSTSSPEVRRALREFDRFLDHHPLLEDRLRLDPQLSTDKVFLGKNPELSDFLRANPNIMEGLKIYPRYYLNRALLRQASAPVSYHELASFKDLFQQQPKLEQELTENPELIRDPAYLESHAALRDFLGQHPALAKVFLPPPIPSASK